MDKRECSREKERSDKEGRNKRKRKNNIKQNTVKTNDPIKERDIKKTVNDLNTLQKKVKEGKKKKKTRERQLTESQERVRDIV